MQQKSTAGDEEEEEESVMRTRRGRWELGGNKERASRIREVER